MLKSTPVLLVTATLMALSAIPPSRAQTPDPTSSFPIQNTQPNCPPDIAGCPVRSDYFTWRNIPIPYILGPRRSKILTPQPLLRWLPVDGVTHYTVTLEGPGVDWRVEALTTTEIQYNGAAPLQPGGNYDLFVVADTGAASWAEPDQVGGIGFQMATGAEQAAIATEVAQLHQTHTDPHTLRRKLAALYLKQGFITAGIAELEALWQVQPNAELAVQLGNLYFGWLLLVEPSETYYQQALALTTGDPTLARAVALAQLGHLQIVQQEFAGAIAFWQQAQTVYRTLGQPQTAAALEENIQRWLHKVE